MSVFVESGIEFDFTRAVNAVQHDKPAPGHGNSVWPGVDFCLQDGPDQIWLEVKSWEPAHFAPKDRGGSRRSFLSKMKSRAFTQEMRNKFLGVARFRELAGCCPPDPPRRLGPDWDFRPRGSNG